MPDGTRRALGPDRTYLGGDEVRYSFVAAASLGYDLSRLPQGHQVARVLRSALRCTPCDLEPLAHRHPGPTREDRWAQVRSARSSAPAQAVLPVPDAGVSGALTHHLDDAAMGGVDALDRMVREDVLDWTWLHSGDLSVQDPVAVLAADVLVDAAASAFCSETAPRPVRRVMATPYLLARASLPHHVDDAPTGHPGVDALLAQVAAGDGSARTAWLSAVDALQPAAASWAPAMHQAISALGVADRLRLATDAQLAAVSAFHAAGLTGRDAAYGAWNALSGAVAATAASDLLPAGQHDLLMRVWWSVRERWAPTGR